MKKLAFVILAAGTTLSAAPALAQDNAAFTGPRVEGILGYDTTRAGSDADNDLNDNDDESIDGLLYGVGVGYDVAFGGAVVGIEGEYTDSTAKVERDGSDIENFGFGRVDTGRDLYIGARAGILATPRTLVYAKAGYTNAKLNILGSDGTTETQRDFKLDGYRIGAGVEQALTTNTFGKIEYRYSNYQNAEVEFPNGATAASYDVDTDRHQIVASFGLRF